jgi:IclR family acetate operon transcriptional repressor
VAGSNSAVTNALDILDLLGQSVHGLRLKDIAARLDLPESTAHRLLAGLVSRGYVQQHDDQSYELGWKIVVLADALGSDARLVQAMRPSLQKLVRELGQTINLAVLSNDQVMYLACQTPVSSLSLYVTPGLTLPVHATSLGKVLLAFSPPDETETVLSRLDYKPLTAQTIADAAGLRAALERVREQGYALDLGELRPDVSCIAVPVRDASGRVRAAISMTAPAAELPADWQTSFPNRLMSAAAEASARFFGSPEFLAAREPASTRI